jgi:hypothetical protein
MSVTVFQDGEVIREIYLDLVARGVGRRGGAIGK